MQACQQSAGNYFSSMESAEEQLSKGVAAIWIKDCNVTAHGVCR